jgi:hypothetical protein
VAANSSLRRKVVTISAARKILDEKNIAPASITELVKQEESLKKML